MSRGGSAGGGQSSLGYLFGGGEAPAPAPKPAAAAPAAAPAATAPPAEKPAPPKADVAKQIPAGVASQTNNYHRADGQNTGNFLTLVKTVLRPKSMLLPVVGLPWATCLVGTDAGAHQAICRAI
ncbi:hypothetical protein EJB05_06095 [Eragrostis curvula]|uniref:Protein SPIRAL1-like 1 n=1 Tax=Eragrostis curvula TaxID=38414 RepID=A0A5J9WGZ2_9POAL|nr:hypothetical protein EJB05_06095 [Eragrostis curvula]